MNNKIDGYIQYAEYIKPSWAPPNYLFGPVWSVLYVIILISFGKVFMMAYHKEIPYIVLLPFILNLVFNFLFTPIQFVLKNNILASIDIILVLGTLVWALIAIYSHARWITWINIPYLLWVCFATILQLTITKLNW